MPDERDITKQQLWERMDELHSSAINIIAGFNTLINSMQDKVARDVTTTLSEQKIIWEKMQEAIVQDNNLKQIDLEHVIDGKFKEMLFHFDEEQKKLNALINNFRDEIKQYVQQQQTDTISTLNMKINELIAHVVEFKNSTDSQMNTYQQEMAVKLGKMVALELDMKTKFKKISEQLSA